MGGGGEPPWLVFLLQGTLASGISDVERVRNEGGRKEPLSSAIGGFLGRGSFSFSFFF